MRARKVAESTDTKDKLSAKVLVLSAISIVLVGVLYSWNIGGFVPGFSRPEVESVSSSHTLQTDNMVDAPYRSLQKLSIGILGENGYGVRAPSVVVGLISVALFYLLLKQLTNKRMSLLATAMFATSSWMLHVSRLGDPTVMNILWPIAIVLVAYHVYQHHLDWYWYLVAGGLLGLAAYTPRMIIFVVFALVVAIAVFHRYEASMHKIGALAGLGVFGLFLAPLVYNAVVEPAVLKELVALPEAIPTLRDLVDTAWNAISTISWHANLPNYLNLGSLPLLDSATLAFAGLGFLVIFTDIRAPRSWLLLGIILSGIIALVVTPLPVTNVYFALPTLSILSGIGIFTLWSHWRELFPINTAARGLALGLLGLVVIFSMSYHFERYYLAWSQVPETTEAFSEQLK
jgi:4-amino-4-deoxy-L-arabinose transferase-like glycosyltransferase